MSDMKTLKQIWIVGSIECVTEGEAELLAAVTGQTVIADWILV